MFTIGSWWVVMSICVISRSFGSTRGTIASDTVQFMLSSCNCTDLHMRLLSQRRLHRMVCIHSWLNVCIICGLPSLDLSEALSSMFSSPQKWNSASRQRPIVRVLIQLFSVVHISTPDYTSIIIITVQCRRCQCQLFYATWMHLPPIPSTMYLDDGPRRHCLINWTADWRWYRPHRRSVAPAGLESPTPH